MKKERIRRHILVLFFCLGIILFIYRNWFTSQQVIGGDWPFYYDAFLKDFSIIPVLWGSWLGNGIGGVQQLLGLHFFGSFIIVPFSQWLHIPWNVVYRVGWFGLFLFFCTFSPIYLIRKVLGERNIIHNILSALIYSTNTYILMVASGGQMGVALAYSVAPLVIGSFMCIVQNTQSKWRNSMLAGIALAFQLLLDPRIAYITLIGVFLYFLIEWKAVFREVLFTIAVPSVVSILLNFFWIFPVAILPKNTFTPMGKVFTSEEAVKFFSFADFSHAFSLLHPNWPENIFGKTYFLQPEFLLIPLLAFFSLFILHKNKKRKFQLIFFNILAILGIFLAKGANSPFGEIYLWMFAHVPGFIMFRDPVKFYLLVALAYSVLIPFVIREFKKYNFLICILIILFWVGSIRQSVIGGLSGTFASHEVPREYSELAKVLEGQKEFFRTLWVPRQQRFSYATLDHMPVEAEPLFQATNPAELKEKLDNPRAQDLLGRLGVRYVIIPYDSLGELFLHSREYDEAKRQEYETVLDGISWLTKIQSGNMTIYETSGYADRFFLSSDEPVSYNRTSQDAYAVRLRTQSSSVLYFSESYHPGWVFLNKQGKIVSQKTPEGLNSFILPASGVYEGAIFFEPQRYVNWALGISAGTLVVLVCLWVAFQWKKMFV